MNRSLLLLVLVSDAVIGLGQQPFIRTYDYNFSPFSTSVAEMPDGGLAFSDGTDLVRLDRDGNIIWSRSLAFSVEDPYQQSLTPLDGPNAVSAVSGTSDGNIVVVGSNYGSQFPQWNALSVKIIACFDPQGQLIWAEISGPTNSALEFRFVTKFLGNRLLATGSAWANLGFGGPGTIAKYSTNGTSLGNGNFYGLNNDYYELNEVVPGADSSILVVGTYGALFKLDSTLAPIWQSTYSGFLPSDMAGHTDGSTIAIGANSVAKYSASGTILWCKSMQAFSNGQHKDVTILPNGNILVLGNATLPYTSSYLMELDTTGEVLWAEQYGAPGEPYQLSELQLLENGGYRLVGGSGFAKTAVVVTDTNGQVPGCPFPTFAPVSIPMNYGTLVPLAGSYQVFGPQAGAVPNACQFGPSYSSQQLLCGIDDSTTFNASGTSFVDMDQDGIHGPGDLPVPWTQVAVSPQTGSLFTLDSGQFVFASADTGSFTFTATSPGPWWVLSTDSVSYTVGLDSLTPTFDSLDFGWASAFDTTVVTTALVGTSTCTGNLVYSLQIHNQGTTRPELLLTLALDAQLTLVNSSPPVDSILGNTLYWHIDSLDPFASWSAALQVTMPWLQNLGDTLNTTFFTYEQDGFGNDTLISTALWSDVILCAYDPNDKRVEPAGSDSANYIWPDTEWLTYTIRFQNTGNATAQNVSIQDYLGPHLQVNTVQILATSHTLTGLAISPYRQLVVRFDNIQLPDSGSDPLASQGFVRFRVRLQPGLPALTEIVNDAGIFFDGNPPVITEAARVTIAHCPFILSTWSALVSAQGPNLSVQLNFTDPNEAVAFQWFQDGLPIPGATNDQYTAQQPGYYRLEVTDAFGCTETSNIAQVIINSIGDERLQSVRVLPNPMHDHATIHLDRPLPESAHIGLFDIQGRMAMSLKNMGTHTLEVDRGSLAPGLYVLRITGADGIFAAVRVMVE